MSKSGNSLNKIAKLGRESTAWTYGLNRRFKLLRNLVDLKDKRILDVGCGVGMFMEQFKKYSGEVYGIDVDEKKIQEAKKKNLNVQVAEAEHLPFEDGFFDVVFLHEVIEHVNDDQKTIEECFRVLKKGGKVIIFAPNRLWPFETHGMFLGKKYIFGNIPLITWLPNFVYKRLTPHVRNYTNGDILKLFKGLNVDVVHHSHVFPGFDGLYNRSRFLGNLVRGLLYPLERTFLHNFGLSHVLVAEKK